MTNPKTIRTARRRARFLEVLGDCAIVTRAAEAAGGSRSAFYAWRREDADFARDWDEAAELGIAALEDEALRRVLDGVETPVFYAGKQVACVRKFSDPLLMFMLRARRPERYRDQLWWRRRGADATPEPPEAATGPDADPGDVLPDGRKLAEMTLDQLREEFLGRMAQQGLAVVQAGDGAGAPADRSLLSGFWGASPRVLSEAPGNFPRGP